jgi:hypothetical protein
MEKKLEGLQISIREKGVSRTYVTNAPFEVIDRLFDKSDDKTDFFQYLSENGYRIERFDTSIKLNFDEK